VVAEEVVVAVDVAVEPNVFAVEVAVAEWGVSMAHSKHFGWVIVDHSLTAKK